jgi:hypothetical protein
LSIELLPVGNIGLVDVIGLVEWTYIPLRVVVLGGEESDLDDDAALLGFRQEVVEAFEVCWVPLRKVELVASAGVAGRGASM